MMLAKIELPPSGVASRRPIPASVPSSCGGMKSRSQTLHRASRTFQTSKGERIRFLVQFKEYWIDVGPSIFLPQAVTLLLLKKFESLRRGLVVRRSIHAHSRKSFAPHLIQRKPACRMYTSRTSTRTTTELHNGRVCTYKALLSPPFILPFFNRRAANNQQTTDLKSAPILMDKKVLIKCAIQDLACSRLFCAISRLYTRYTRYQRSTAEG